MVQKRRWSMALDDDSNAFGALTTTTPIAAAVMTDHLPLVADEPVPLTSVISLDPGPEEHHDMFYILWLRLHFYQNRAEVAGE
jgi:hypothetical protein